MATTKKAKKKKAKKRSIEERLASIEAWILAADEPNRQTSERQIRGLSKEKTNG